MLTFILKLGITSFILAIIPIIAMVAIENLIDDYIKFDIENLETILYKISLVFSILAFLFGLVWVFGVIWSI